MAVSEEIRKKVEQVIEQVRPNLQMDGGDVKLVEISDDFIVKVELQGACRGCPMSQLTLQMGIERTVKKEVPEIKGVENINSPLPKGFMDRFRQAQAEKDEEEE